MSKNKNKHVRELELSRALARLFDAFPYDAVNKIYSALFNIYRMDPDNPVDLDTRAEHVPEKKGDRFDVFIPLTPDIQIREDYRFKEIIFETKLNQADTNQLKRYVTGRPEALIVSIAKDSNKDPIERCVNLEWNDFIGGLIPFLGGDAKSRLKLDDDLVEKSAFSPNPPVRYIGRECEERLEDFIRAVIERGLISNPNRYIVGTGERAVKGCRDFNCYAFGPNWDSNFSYVMIVYKNKVQYVGKVERRYTDVEFNDGRLVDHEVYRDCPQLLEFAKYWAKDEPNRKGPIVVLRKWDKQIFPEEYHGKGAFTYSHRYFDSKEDLISALNSVIDSENVN